MRIEKKRRDILTHILFYFREFFLITNECYGRTKIVLWSDRMDSIPG